MRSVAAAVRAGATPELGWAGVGVRTAGGVPIQADLRRLGAGHEICAAVVATARVSARAGAPPAVLLDGVADALEAEAEVEGRRRAALAGPAASARVLAALPLVGLLLGVAVGADPVAVLVDGGPGTAALVAGTIVGLAGRVWSQRLIAAAARVGGSGRAPVPGRGRVAGLRPPASDEVPGPVLAELVDACCTAGSGIPGALALVGRAAGGRSGEALADAAALLRLGASWPEAWSTAPEAVGGLADALAPAWRDGVAPGGLLRAASRADRRVRVAAANEAAGRLGVWLLLPLTVCHLPAFVLVGILPVLASLGRGIAGGQ